MWESLTNYENCKRHERIPTGEKPECTDSGNTFRSCGSVREHMVLNKGDLINVNIVEKPLLITMKFYTMKGLTLERNPIYVCSVGKLSEILFFESSRKDSHWREML
jgi:hypothetical protein